MKKLLILICLLIPVSIIGCTSSSEEKIKEVSGVAELRDEFNYMKELKKEAELIVEAKVIEQESIVYQDLPFTISEVEILNKYKGNLKKGDKIKVIETGGPYHPKDKDGKDLPLVEFNLNGVKTMTINDHLFLFLESFIGPQIEGAFIPLGAYQGKFKIENNKIKQQSSSEYKLKDFAESTTEEFIKKLIN